MTLSRKQLQWTERDTRMVQEFKQRVAEGKERMVDITQFSLEDMKRYMSNELPTNFWFCANCECYDQADGDRKQCDCPCHKPGGCNYR